MPFAVNPTLLAAVMSLVDETRRHGADPATLPSWGTIQALLEAEANLFVRPGQVAAHRFFSGGEPLGTLRDIAIACARLSPPVPFDRSYQLLEEFLYRPTVPVETWTELFGFRFPVDTLLLEPETSITWMTRQQYDELSACLPQGFSDTRLHAPTRMPGPLAADFGWYVKQEKEFPRTVGSRSTDTDTSDLHWGAVQVFLALTLFLDGGWRVGRSFVRVKDWSHHHSIQTHVVPPLPFPGNAIGATVAEAEAFPSFYRDFRLAAANHDYFGAFLFWLHAAGTQASCTLRFVLWMFALETLLLEGENRGSVGTSMSEALARTLGEPELMTRCSALWKQRCALVHGRAACLEEEKPGQFLHLVRDWTRRAALHRIRDGGQEVDAWWPLVPTRR